MRNEYKFTIDRPHQLFLWLFLCFWGYMSASLYIDEKMLLLIISILMFIHYAYLLYTDAVVRSIYYDSFLYETYKLKLHDSESEEYIYVSSYNEDELDLYMTLTFGDSTYEIIEKFNVLTYEKIVEDLGK